MIRGAGTCPVEVEVKMRRQANVALPQLMEKAHPGCFGLLVIMPRKIPRPDQPINRAEPEFLAAVRAEPAVTCRSAWQIFLADQAPSG